MRRLLIIVCIFVGTSLVVVAGCGSDASEAPDGAGQTVPSGAAGTVPPTLGDSAATEPGSYVTVDVETAYEALTTQEGAQLVDVREPSEWADTGVPLGAVLIPLGQLEARAPAELAADRPVYVICRSGNRSRTGSEILLGLGYRMVYNVDGGIRAWLGADLPVEAYTP